MGLAEGLAEGRAEEARNLLLMADSRRLGAPDVPTLQLLAGITSRERLEALVLRLFEVETSAELLTAIPESHD